MPLRQRRVRRYRRCHFCGCSTYVLMPPGASDLDVDAEFSGQAREFGLVEDDGGLFACVECAAKQREKVA